MSNQNGLFFRYEICFIWYLFQGYKKEGAYAFYSRLLTYLLNPACLTAYKTICQ